MLKKSLAIACVATLLSACGGGGGGGGGAFAIPGTCTGTFPGTRRPHRRLQPTRHRQMSWLSIPRPAPTFPQHRDFGHLERSLAGNDGDRQQSAHYPFGGCSSGLVELRRHEKQDFLRSDEGAGPVGQLHGDGGDGPEGLGGQQPGRGEVLVVPDGRWSWDAPHELEAVTTNPGNLAAVQDGQGNTVAIWASQVVQVLFQIRTAVQNASGDWGDSSRLSTPGNYRGPGSADPLRQPRQWLGHLDAIGSNRR